MPHFLTLPFSYYGNKIPLPIHATIERLREINAKDIPGIFRLNGSSSEITNLLNELDSGAVANWDIYNGIVIACALKSYFREIAKFDPLLSFEFYDLLVAIADIPNQSVVLDRISKVLMDLSTSRMLSLAYLMNFLHEIGENSEVNKMTFNNLAICFAPNILSSRKQDEQTIMFENPQQNKVVSLLIQNAPELFKFVQLSKNSFFTTKDTKILVYDDMDEEHLEMIKKRIEIRKKTLMPFTPQSYFRDPGFKRPTRKVVL